MNEMFSDASSTYAAIAWRRLDRPGHETASLTRVTDGWRVSGVATLIESGRPCRLEYDIDCGAGWMTQGCRIRGSLGESAVAIDVARSAKGEWSIDGIVASSLDGCEDIDLGFSPSTNLLPIRRLRLAVGSRATVRAAWVRFPELTCEVLEQAYTRLAPERYLYESAGGTFRRELIVDAAGFVLDYPGLWLAEDQSGLSDAVATH